MSDIKYLGVQGLEELIILTKNNLAKKADVLQFDVMPDPTEYIGKIVQYVGVSDISFTRSHFYYSNGTKWTEENTSGEPPKIEMVTALPSWVDSDPQVLYILKNAADITMNFYVKNPSVNGAWFTVEKSASFVVVASLPQWTDADSSIIYFKANGNDLVGYIKNIYTTDAWYTFGEKPQITIDAIISATSENPVQNKVIFTEINTLRAQANMILTASQDADKELHDGIEANSNALGMLGTEVSGIHDDIEANSNALYNLGIEVGNIHDDITANQTEINTLRAQANMILTASQDADKELRHDIDANGNALHDLGIEVGSIHDDITANRAEIDANGNALGMLGTEVSGIHDDITANQTEIEAIKRNLLDTYATQRYVQNQNLLSDFEDIVISVDPRKPTRMEYDGYVTAIDDTSSMGVRLAINGVPVGCAEENKTASTVVTVFVAKNDDLCLGYASSDRVAKARFYKLRDYTNRPPKA